MTEQDNKFICPRCGVGPVLANDAHYDPAYGRFWHCGCWLQHHKEMEENIDSIFEDNNEKQDTGV